MQTPQLHLLPDRYDTIHIVALSGGKDSTAMAIVLKERNPATPYNYICTPTGNESPEMFAHWRRLGDLLGRPVQPIFAGTLERQIALENMLPSVFARWCTRKLKIAPYIALMDSLPNAISYVGLRADEPHRDGITEHGGDLTAPTAPHLRQAFPLRELGWTLQDVLAYLNSRSIKIPDRTDCRWCPYQRLAEWYLLWLNDRECYDAAANLERRYGHSFRSPARDRWPAFLDDLAARFQRGDRPEISLKRLGERTGQCRACTL